MSSDIYTEDMFDDQPKPSSSRALSRRNDPETSVTATKYTNINKLEAEVVWAIAHFMDGCIYDDVIKLLPHRRVHSIQPRFAPLLRKRIIINTGEKRVGLSGRKQRVVKINLKDRNDS